MNVPVAPKEQLFLQQQPHLHPLQLSFGVFHPVFLLDYPQQVVHEIPQTSGQLLVSARLVLPKQLDYSPLGSNQTTNHHSLFLVPLQVQEVLQAARTLVLRLLPQQPDSGQFVRPLQLGPPQPALGLHFPRAPVSAIPLSPTPFPVSDLRVESDDLVPVFSPCSFPGVFISSRSRSSFSSAVSAHSSSARAAA